MESELLAEGINVLLVLSAEEGPFQELVAPDQAGRVGGDLVLYHALEDGEDLAAHLAGLSDRELEK